MKTTTGETVLYSGREDDLHHEGVAIIMKKGMEKYLMEWKPVNSRIIQARLKGRQSNLSIIQCYAPTNDSNDRDKEAFYEQLQATFENVHCRDFLLVMGDLNAKVGSDNLNFERVMGRGGCGVQNDNGERLVEWCAFNNMIIGGALFPHRNIHKLTWTSPNGRDQNQIDHLMVNSMWRRSLPDVRVRRGADASSDHHLVTAKVRLKLRAAGPNKQRTPRYDFSRLQDQRTKNAFVLQLRNRFQALSNIDEQSIDEEEDTVNQQWKQVKNIFDEASKTCLGMQKTRKKKEWITPDTWQAIEERRQLKKKINDSKSARLREKYRAAYTETNRRVKRKIRTDKRAYMEGIARCGGNTLLPYMPVRRKGHERERES